MSAYDVWILGIRQNIQVNTVLGSQLEQFQVIVTNGYGPKGPWTKGDKFAEDLIDHFPLDIQRLGIYNNDYIIR